MFQSSKMLQTYFSKLIQLIALCAAIAWKKKKFKSKFMNEANYIQFTKLTTRLLDAHTTQLANAIQLEIVEWLLPRVRTLLHRGSRGTGLESVAITPMHQPVTATTTLRALIEMAIFEARCLWRCRNQPVVAA
jgi:hypothetical protein